MVVAKVDVVYTWCGLPENGRCTFTKDLAYSIKSVQQHLKDYRKIWIVIDDIVTEEHLQKAGIDMNDTSINLVHHRQIIPKKFLPVLWNSNVVESWVWKIRGLSEYFLYMCDDMYLGKTTTLDMFYFDNQPILRVNKGHPDHFLTAYQPSNDYIEMWQNAIEKHGIHYTRHAHNCQPYKRSLMKKYYTQYKTEVDKASKNATRNGKKDFNLLRFSGSLAVMNGEAILIATDEETYDYFVESSHKQNVKQILKIKPQFFCINNTHKDQSWVYDMLDTYFTT